MVWYLLLSKFLVFFTKDFGAQWSNVCSLSEIKFNMLQNFHNSIFFQEFWYFWKSNNFVGLLLLMHKKGLIIDKYLVSWWCAPKNCFFSNVFIWFFCSSPIKLMTWEFWTRVSHKIRIFCGLFGYKGYSPFPNNFAIYLGWKKKSILRKVIFFSNVWKKFAFWFRYV